MRNKEVKIIDFGWGNLEALRNFFEKNATTAEVLHYSKYLELKPKGSVVIIPGIGSANCFSRFDEETKERIRDHFKHEKKIVGICLGAHFLGNENAEGENKGLGILDFKTVLLSKNNLGYSDTKCGNEIFRIYYCHSYHMKHPCSCTNSSFIKGNICAYFKEEKYIAIQGHPEKSGKDGYKFLRMLLSD